MIKYWICASFLLFFYPFIVQGQGDSFSIELRQGTFSELVDLLEREFDVNFSYRSDLLQDQEFYLKTNTTDLTNILNEITSIHAIEYQLLNDQSILLRDRLSVDDSRAPNNRRLLLTILDSDTQTPLEAAAVGIQGTARGAYTDISGKIAIDLPEEQEPVLEIQLLGYQRKHHLIQDDVTLTI